MDIFTDIQRDVADLMGQTMHGHGIDHVSRVYRMSALFCKEAKANQEIVALTALLHDADDYKLFGDTGDNFPNANAIMQKNNIAGKTCEIVLDNIKNMGYSKRLAGVIPKNLEGMIVSDADMCDAMGATGIVRTIEYNNSKGRAFWNENRFPATEPTAEQYKAGDNPTVDHFFEKLLKLKDFMLTEPGKKEASTRHSIMVSFLRQFFSENNAAKWIAFMDDFLAK
jgi:uncharacterized protein